MHNAHYCHLPDGSLGSQPSSVNSKIRGGINLLGIVMVVLPPSSTHVALIYSPVREKFCPWLYHSSKNTHLRIASLLPLLSICQPEVQLGLLEMSSLTQKCFNFIYWVLQLYQHFNVTKISWSMHWIINIIMGQETHTNTFSCWVVCQCLDEEQHYQAVTRLWKSTVIIWDDFRATWKSWKYPQKWKLSLQSWQIIQGNSPKITQYIA